jgi:ActR/RegA family two-component response regulator
MDTCPVTPRAKSPRRIVWSDGSEGPSQRPHRPQVVIVTTDHQLHETASEAVRLLHGTASVAETLDDILILARACRQSLSLALLDQSFAGDSVLALARALRDEVPEVPFVLVGRELTTSTTVEAMKLGALTVLEKPVVFDDIVATIRSLIEARMPGADSNSTTNPGRFAARSTAERWAVHVLKGCEASGDLRTLGAWATFAGLSYSSLCESCRLAFVRPLDARDLTRILRAVVQSHVHQCRPEELLDIGDRRTLKALMARAGLSPTRNGHRVSIAEFLVSQRFVPSNNAGLAVLRARLLH